MLGLERERPFPISGTRWCFKVQAGRERPLPSYLAKTIFGGTLELRERVERVRPDPTLAQNLACAKDFPPER